MRIQPLISGCPGFYQVFPGPSFPYALSNSYSLPRTLRQLGHFLGPIQVIAKNALMG